MYPWRGLDVGCDIDAVVMIYIPEKCLQGFDGGCGFPMGPRSLDKHSSYKFRRELNLLWGPES